MPQHYYLLDTLVLYVIILGKLSKGYAKRQKPTRSWLFAFFSGFVRIFGQIVSIRVKILSKTNLTAPRYIKMEKVSLPVDVRDSKSRLIDRLRCHATKKKKIGNRPVEEAKTMKCYKRLVYKQFIQVSGRCRAEFLGYFLKRFTHLCRVWRRHIGVPFWCTNMAAGNQQKHLEFTFSPYF